MIYNPAMRMPAAFLALIALAMPAGATDWRETSTPHYSIYHEDVFLPAGLTMGIEQVYFRLGMDLNVFTTWSDHRKINLYLYRDLRSYAQGEYHPPPWSNGFAVYSRRAVVLPGMKTVEQLLRVLAHETTHVIFVGYFSESHRDPPDWINEGLAMLEETNSRDKPESSVWFQQMVATGPREWYGLDSFFGISPQKDLGNDAARVRQWYVQAYSIVFFLARKHQSLQFKSLCGMLRDGRPPAEAIRLVYHDRTLADFEKRWRAWVSDPALRRRAANVPLHAGSFDDGVIDQAGQWRSSFP